MEMQHLMQQLILQIHYCLKFEWRRKGDLSVRNVDDILPLEEEVNTKKKLFDDVTLRRMNFLRKTLISD